MKVLSRLMLFVALATFGASASANNEIQVPRKVSPTISIKDRKAVNAYLVSLVEEYEGRKSGSGDEDVSVYLEPTDNVCKLKKSKLTCEYSYLQDRWNGEVSVTFTVSKGQIVELTQAGFGGNF